MTTTRRVYDTFDFRWIVGKWLFFQVQIYNQISYILDAKNPESYDQMIRRSGNANTKQPGGLRFQGMRSNAGATSSLEGSHNKSSGVILH